LGLVVGGAGVVGLAVGAIFVMDAKAKYNDSVKLCDGDDKNLCPPDGVSTRNDARAAGNVATVASALGAAALVAGAVLYLTAPSTNEKPSAVVVPTAGNGSAGLAFVGTY
jgi:hypothetical protein